MKQSLNDPDSYKAIDYSNLGALYINPGDKKNADDILQITGDRKEYEKQVAPVSKKPLGFHLQHKFSFKNTSGGTEVHTWDFNFNRDVTSIANIEKNNDMQPE